MAMIKFPVSAFATAARDYTKEGKNGVDACVWRELLQNSRDAGATKVECKLEPVENGVKITVIDNGKGMDEQTLIDGLLTYSGSIKTIGNAGGFGMAKCLLIFAPFEYEIRTGSKYVFGSGLEYEMTDSETIEGTSISITYKNQEDKSLLIQPTIEGLKFLMARCDMQGMQVSCNGEVLPDAGTVQGTVIKEFAEYKCKVYWHEEGTQISDMNGNHIIVFRHRGIWVRDGIAPKGMKGVVVVNVDDEAKNCLTANRCGFSDYGISSSVNGLLNDLVKSPETVLHPKNCIIRYPGLVQKVERNREVFERCSGETDMEVLASTIVREIPYLVGCGSYELLLSTLKENKDNIGTRQLETMASDPAMLIVNEHVDRDVDARYKRETIAKRPQQLLTMWTELVRQMLILRRVWGSFGVGFIFSPRKQAAYMYDSEIHWFLLNPENQDGSQRFELSNADDRENMIVSTAHEVAHRIAEGDYHGDDFVREYDENMRLALINKNIFNNVWKKAR